MRNDGRKEGCNDGADRSSYRGENKEINQAAGSLQIHFKDDNLSAKFASQQSQRFSSEIAQ